MDTRDTPEQAELRSSARRLSAELAAHTVADLDDTDRTARLRAAITAAGWLELRDDAGDGAPLAGGVEAAIVADALGGAVADAAFTGPLLAADLGRRAGVTGPAAAVASTPDLSTVAAVADPTTTIGLVAVDVEPAVGAAWVLVPDGPGHRLATLTVPAPDADATDLTRRVRTVPAGTTVTPVATSGLLTAHDLAAWTALGLALTSADLVGLMRGVLDLTVTYAGDRHQYGVAIGSFQAVAHLLAEARCLLDGSRSISQYAAWAVDALPPAEALEAGRMAKAYAVRAARTVCETAVQVHGGIGNTWECIVHVYLRRALLSSQWFGDDGAALAHLGASRLGVDDGLL